MATEKESRFLITVNKKKLTRLSFCAGSRWFGVLGAVLLLTGVVACSGSGGGGASARPRLMAIMVNPSSASIAVGTTLQLRAIGVFSNNSTQDLTASATWSSADTSIAEVGNGSANKGLATGINLGVTTISAEYGGVQGSGTFTIVGPGRELISISIDPINPSIANGTSLQLQATGIFSDNTTQDLTTLVDWSSAHTAIAQVGNVSGNKGLVTAQGVGITTVFATLGDIQGSTKLTVTAATLTSIVIDPASASIALGTKLQLQAIGNFSDGTTQLLTTSAAWASTDTSIVTVSNTNSTKGMVTAAGLGTTTVTATEGGITGVSTITVTAATLTSITISPVDPEIAKGTQVQLTATGNFTDGTTEDLTETVIWSSSRADIASVSNTHATKGLVTGLDIGSAEITAKQAGIQGSTTVTVGAARLTAITVDPPDATIAKGTTVQLKATGNYTDGTTEDLTDR